MKLARALPALVAASFAAVAAAGAPLHATDAGDAPSIPEALARLGVEEAEARACSIVEIPGRGPHSLRQRVVRGVPVRGSLLVLPLPSASLPAEPRTMGSWSPLPPERPPEPGISDDVARSRALRALGLDATQPADVRVEPWQEPDATPLRRVRVDAGETIGVVFLHALTGVVVDSSRAEAPWVAARPGSARSTGGGMGERGGIEAPRDKDGTPYSPSFDGAEAAWEAKKPLVLDSCLAGRSAMAPAPEDGPILAGLLEGGAMQAAEPGGDDGARHVMYSAGVEGFEGAWPDAYWTTYDANATSGTDTWNDVSCSVPRSGSWHAWCAGNGRTACTTYDNDMRSGMYVEATYGGTTGAGNNRLHFWMKQQVENGFDRFRVYVDGFLSQPPHGGGAADVSFYWEWPNDVASYTWWYLELPAAYDPIPYLRIHFVFESDASVTDTGAYVDDICFNGNCEGGRPANAIFPMAPCTLGAFSQLTPTSGSALGCPGSVSLDWGSSTGAARYDVFVDGSYATSVTTSAASLVFTPGTHSWDVRSYCADGATWRWSENGPFQISVSDAPGAFNQLAPAAGASTCSTSVLFDWSDAGSAGDYVLLLDGNVLATPTSSSHVATVPVGPHTWDVQARCGGNVTWSANGPFGLTVATVPATFDLVAPPNNATSCAAPTLLDWADAAGATSYDVLVDGSLRATTTASQWAPTGLTTGTHSWSVTARNSCGGRGSNGSRQFTIQSGQSPGQPSSPSPPTAAILTSCPTLLDWADASGATSYDLEIDGSSAATGLTSSQHSTSLSTGSHSWRVTARSACGQTAGPTWTFSCSPEPPMTVSIPSGLTVARGGEIDVPVNLSAGGGVAGAQLSVTLSPPGCLSVVGVTAGSRLTPPGAFTITTSPAVISTASPSAGPVGILVDSTGTAMPSGSGSLIVLRIRASSECAAGTSVAVTPAAATLTRNLVSEAALTAAGSVTVTAPPVACLGDLDATLSRDSTDVVLLRRAVVGLTPPSPVPPSADYDQNGFVDSTDVVRLRRCVTGLEACTSCP